MKTALVGNPVVEFEKSMMLAALKKMLRKDSDAAKLDHIVAALREAKSTGPQFARFNQFGLRATLSRWLRAGAFEGFVLTRGCGVVKSSVKNLAKAVLLPYSI